MRQQVRPGRAHEVTRAHREGLGNSAPCPSGAITGTSPGSDFQPRVI